MTMKQYRQQDRDRLLRDPAAVLMRRRDGKFTVATFLHDVPFEVDHGGAYKLDRLPGDTLMVVVEEGANGPRHNVYGLPPDRVAANYLGDDE